MKYTPSDIERLTKWSADGLRDMRRREFIRNYGEASENGRWQYSLRDLVAFYVADRLWRPSKDGLMLHTALAIGWANAPHVIDLIRGKVATKYLAILDKTDTTIFSDQTLSGSSIVEIEEISDLANNEFDEAHLINLKRIADTAPLRIKAEVLEG